VGWEREEGAGKRRRREGRKDEGMRLKVPKKKRKIGGPRIVDPLSVVIELAGIRRKEDKKKKLKTILRQMELAERGKWKNGTETDHVP